jgi:phenylacetate-CoA ligase
VELSSPPKAVLSRGETLTAGSRATIEQAFRRRVADHYATNEVPHLAQSCPEGAAGLHVLGDRVIIRVVRDDGRPAAPGEAGRVLLTDLENHVMPFINYAVGDRAVAGGACACGRGLPVLAALDGREAEVIHLPNGDLLSTFTVDSFMRRHCDVRMYREYQIVQTARAQIEIRLVPTPELTPQAADRLRQGFEAFLGAGVSISVVEVDEIPWEPSGKRLAVKTHAPA